MITLKIYTLLIGMSINIEYNDSTGNNPVVSFGIILFYIDPNNSIWYLLAQRRDTIEYTDFMRGRYTKQTLEHCMSLMSREERQRIINYTFDELWDDLWVNHDNKFYRDIKSKAIVKYNAIKPMLETLLNSTFSGIKEPGWGFPKGRRNIRETELQCAVREFKEETKMSINHENILNMEPTTEVFKGTNNKMYSTVYYIAQVDHKIPVRKMPLNGIRKETVSEEISNLVWSTLQDSVDYLPPWRYKLLHDVEKKIRRAQLS